MAREEAAAWRLKYEELLQSSTQQLPRSIHYAYNGSARDAEPASSPSQRSLRRAASEKSLRPGFVTNDSPTNYVDVTRMVLQDLISQFQSQETWHDTTFDDAQFIEVATLLQDTFDKLALVSF